MPQETVTIPLAEVEAIAFKALTAHRTSEKNARSVTLSIVAAEADGIHSHGLARLATYCQHAQIGKVDGQASPDIAQPRPGVLIADAHTGFAHPAIDIGLERLMPAARTLGLAALGVTNSYNCGVVGHHVERLAGQGFVALAFVNAPASIAPWGGHRALFGTDPIAFAAPRRGAPPLVIDQSSSVVARGEIMVHVNAGKPIPEGWALDADGKPTTDPDAALKGGSLLPAGGYKGAGLALMVELLAAGLLGANFGFKASSFATDDGGPPRTGQFFLAIDPAGLGGVFTDRVEEISAAILAQPGTRLPGERRLKARERTARDGVTLGARLHADLKKRAGMA